MKSYFCLISFSLSHWPPCISFDSRHRVSVTLSSCWRINARGRRGQRNIAKNIFVDRSLVNTVSKSHCFRDNVTCLFRVLLLLFEGQSRQEINSYRATPFRFNAIHPLLLSLSLSLRHTLPPALGGFCALSLLSPIIHRDCSSTVLSLFYFLFLFFSLIYIHIFFPRKHNRATPAYLSLIIARLILSKFVKLASSSRFNG